MFRALQKDLGILRVRDVEHRPDEPRDFAGGIANGAAALGHPALLAILEPDGPVLDIETPGASGLPHALDRFVDDVAIVRMDAREIGFVGDLCLRRDAE